MVSVKPFDINYKDIKATIAKHGFDQSMNYNIQFNVPVKYLGQRLIINCKITPTDAAKLETFS
jgi:hypothetical protein